MGDRPLLTRRKALGLLGLALPLGVARAQQQQGDTTTPARLWDPYRAGQGQQRITDYENDPFIVGIESKIRCTCGCTLSVYTCRTTDFNCTVSPAMHREVVALAKQGKTAQQIIDSFVAEYGEEVLMAPPKQGFNLAAYFVPGAAVSLVGAVLVMVLLRRRRAARVEAADVPSGLSTDEQALLDQELRDLER